MSPREQDYIKVWAFLYQRRDYQFLKKKSALWSLSLLQSKSLS